MAPLLAQKKQVQIAALGQQPDRLVHSTVQTVMRLAKKESPGRVLAPRVLRLVRKTLRALSLKEFKIETALLLRKSRVIQRREGDGTPQ